MKAVQITLDEKLLKEVDRILKGERRRRSAFIRSCIRAEISRRRVREDEEREREAYRRKPVRKGEADVWDSVQTWPDE